MRADNRAAGPGEGGPGRVRPAGPSAVGYGPEQACVPWTKRLDLAHMKVSLVMLKDNGVVKDFPIALGQTVIGRREDCDLRIPLKEISRKHALLMVGDKMVSIRDLGSANGTYINNQRVVEHKLSPGDHIVVGPVVFTIQIDGQPSEIRPVKTRLEARGPSVDEQKITMKKPRPADDDDIDIDLDDEENDAISALEAMTNSDETTEIDLDDSGPDLPPPPKKR